MKSYRLERSKKLSNKIDEFLERKKSMEFLSKIRLYLTIFLKLRTFPKILKKFLHNQNLVRLKRNDLTKRAMFYYLADDDAVNEDGLFRNKQFDLNAAMKQKRLIFIYE